MRRKSRRIITDLREAKCPDLGGRLLARIKDNVRAGKNDDSRRYDIATAELPQSLLETLFLENKKNGERKFRDSARPARAASLAESSTKNRFSRAEILHRKQPRKFHGRISG